MEINIKDKILQTRKEKHKYCLLKVDYNQFCWNGNAYIVNEFSNSYKRNMNNNVQMKVTRQELLDLCNLFVSRFMNGKDVNFFVLKNLLYEDGRILSYKECKDTNMSLFDFSNRMNDIHDCNETQHFQFKVSSKKSELCGFIHGVESLSEFSKNMALNLDKSKVKLKIKL